MRIIFQKSFQKDFTKCPAKVRIQAQERIELFVADRFNPLLNLHALKGDYVGCWSINVNADVRIIFYQEDDMMVLLRVGSHSKLYE